MAGLDEDCRGPDVWYAVVFAPLRDEFAPPSHGAVGCSSGRFMEVREQYLSIALYGHITLDSPPWR